MVFLQLITITALNVDFLWGSKWSEPIARDICKFKPLVIIYNVCSRHLSFKDTKKYGWLWCSWIPSTCENLQMYLNWSYRKLDETIFISVFLSAKPSMNWISLCPCVLPKDCYHLFQRLVLFVMFLPDLLAGLSRWKVISWWAQNWSSSVLWDSSRMLIFSKIKFSIYWSFLGVIYTLSA